MGKVELAEDVVKAFTKNAGKEIDETAAKALRHIGISPSAALGDIDKLGRSEIKDINRVLNGAGYTNANAFIKHQSELYDKGINNIKTSYMSSFKDVDVDDIEKAVGNIESSKGRGFSFGENTASMNHDLITNEISRMNNPKLSNYGEFKMKNSIDKNNFSADTIRKQSVVQGNFDKDTFNKKMSDILGNDAENPVDFSSLDGAKLQKQLNAQMYKEAETKDLMTTLKYKKVPQVAAGVGTTAWLVSRMSESKGQMTNAQLYGQKPY